MRMFSDKRGNVFDTFIIPVMVLMLIIITVIGGTILWHFNDYVQNDPYSDANTKSVIAELFTNFTGSMDYSIVLYFFAISLFSIISAFYIKSSPLYFIIGLPIWMFSWYLVPNLANIAYNVLNAGSEVTNFTQYLTMTNFLVTNFFLLNLIVGAAILFALFSKNDQGGGKADAFD